MWCLFQVPCIKLILFRSCRAFWNCKRSEAIICAQDTSSFCLLSISGLPLNLVKAATFTRSVVTVWNQELWLSGEITGHVVWNSAETTMKHMLGLCHKLGDWTMFIIFGVSIVQFNFYSAILIYKHSQRIISHLFSQVMKVFTRGKKRESQLGVILVGMNVLLTLFLSSEKCTHES